MNRQPDYDRAATMAYRCRIKFGGNRAVIDPLEILKMCRNTIVIPFDVLEKDLPPLHYNALILNQDGFTMREKISGGESRYIVGYNTEARIVRKRFTLAHELGHIALKHSNQTWVEEAEANHFAMHLLCPKPAVRAIAQHYKDNLDQGHFARAFGISEACAGQIVRSRKCRVPEDILSDFPQSQVENALVRSRMWTGLYQRRPLNWETAYYHY